MAFLEALRAKITGNATQLKTGLAVQAQMGAEGNLPAHKDGLASFTISVSMAMVQAALTYSTESIVSTTVFAFHEVT